MTGRWRRAVAFAIPVAALCLLAVLVVEVLLARRGPTLAGPPLDLDGRVGGGPGAVLRTVWLGDSTAAGVGVDEPEDALAHVVSAALGRPVELTVLAVSGDRVGDLITDQLSAAAAADPDLVFISVGANDVTHLTSRDDFRSQYRTVLDRLPEGADVVVLGVPDMGAVPRLAQPLRAIAGGRGRQLDEVVRAVAEEAGATYVPIAEATGPNFRAEPEVMFAADDYHPSAAGYRLWAAAVLAEVPDLTSTG